MKPSNRNVQQLSLFLGKVLFPGGRIRVEITEPKYRVMFENILTNLESKSAELPRIGVVPLKAAAGSMGSKNNNSNSSSSASKSSLEDAKSNLKKKTEALNGKSGSDYFGEDSSAHVYKLVQAWSSAASKGYSSHGADPKVAEKLLVKTPIQFLSTILELEDDEGFLVYSHEAGAKKLSHPFRGGMSGSPTDDARSTPTSTTETETETPSSSSSAKSTDSKKGKKSKKVVAAGKENENHAVEEVDSTTTKATKEESSEEMKTSGKTNNKKEGKKKDKKKTASDSNSNSIENNNSNKKERRKEPLERLPIMPNNLMFHSAPFVAGLNSNNDLYFSAKKSPSWIFKKEKNADGSVTMETDWYGESVGTIAHIVHHDKLPDGRLYVDLEGVTRFRVVSPIRAIFGYWDATVEQLEDTLGSTDLTELQALALEAKSLLYECLELDYEDVPDVPIANQELLHQLNVTSAHPEALAEFSYHLASLMPVPTTLRQQLLTTIDTFQRLTMQVDILKKFIEKHTPPVTPLPSTTNHQATSPEKVIS